MWVRVYLYSPSSGQPSSNVKSERVTTKKGRHLFRKLMEAEAASYTKNEQNLEVRMVILFFVISDFRPLEARAVRVFSNIYCYCFWGFLFTSFIYLQVLRLTSMFRILSAPERKVQRREIETAGGRNEIFFTVFWKHLRNFREYFCNDTITKSS